MSSAQGPPRWAVVRADGLSLALAGCAAIFVATMPGGASGAFPAPWWMLVGIGLAYGLSERFLFDIEVRRESISFSMSEVPTVFALAFLGPIPAIAIRVIASITAIAWSSRPPLFKVLFNASLFAFEVALAFAIARRIAEPGVAEAGWFLVAAGVGTTVATVAGLVMVCLVISFFEGDLTERLGAELSSTMATAATGSMIATVAVSPALLSIGYAWTPLIPIAGVWLVLRNHGVLTQQHRDLNDLHGFTGIVDRSLQLDEIAPKAIDEISRLVGAERVTLELRQFEDGVPSIWSYGAPIDLTGLAARSDVARGDVSVISKDETLDSCTSFVVSIVDDRDLLGVLAIAHPTNPDGRFSDREVERAIDLANQFGSAIRNGLLHARVEFAARHDPLTGEANRGAFEQQLLERLGAPRSGALAVLVLDLNRFKEVNDTLGHHVGDQVLVEFASRLSDLIDDDDLLCRLGGDEFAILTQRSTKEEVRDLAEQIRSVSYQPLSLEACDAVVTSSIGIAFVGTFDEDMASVLRRADIAMYTAKVHRSGVEVYREDIDRRTPARLSLLGDLRAAIEMDQLEVHFQPKVDLRTEQVIGAEALVRWNHPDRGWVRPDDFIGVAEESGLIRLVTDVVLGKSIRQAACWRAAGYDFDIAVNLSALDLHGADLAGRIQSLLAQHGLDAGHLVLEITESALMVDTERTMGTIDALDHLGIRLALDDFGTGYSSLTYLRRLPVAELKIDRSFVSDLLVNGNDDVIVRSTIDLGHNLGLLVVAEGVENSQVNDHLAELGCDIAQGYGIARPLAPELFEQWLDSTTHGTRRIRPVELVRERAG